MNKTIKIIPMIFAILLIASFASALTISNVDVPSQVKQGQNAAITLTLKNEGNNDITDVSVVLQLSAIINPQTGAVISPDLPFTPVDSSNTETSDKIRTDKSESFDFTIQALNNAKSGVYKIPVIVTYLEDVTPATPTKQITGIISLTVNSPPILDVQREEGLLLKGQSNTVIFKMVNKGLSDVSFLEVSLDDGAGYSVTSPKKVYIGTIASDDTDTAQFTVYFNPTSPSTVSFPVTLVYNDVTNKQYTQEFSVDARVYSQKEAISLGLVKTSNVGLYVIIIVIVIILYLIYRRIRKWMKNRKNKREAS
jgi:hypothetical protein